MNVIGAAQNLKWWRHSTRKKKLKDGWWSEKKTHAQDTQTIKKNENCSV